MLLSGGVNANNLISGINNNNNSKSSAISRPIKP